MTGILTMLLAILGLSACSAGETSARPGARGGGAPAPRGAFF